MNVKVLLSSIAVSILMWLTGPVFAHAMLEQSSPARNEVLETAPKQITLIFGHPVKLTQFKLVAEGKNEIVVTPDLKAVAATNFAVPIPPLAAGKYQLTWSALSNDGHAMRGTLPFSIHKNSTAP